MDPSHVRIQVALHDAVADARTDAGGAPADYIPELARAPLEATSAAVITCAGDVVVAGDAAWHRFTLQSSAKLLLLAGLLEERGPDEVFSVVGAEPSGGSFASLARLETDPKPANPLINPGAIALASLLSGSQEDRVAWMEGWAERLYGQQLPLHQRVLVSERRTADRNRAIAFLLKHAGVLQSSVDDTLETYFALCAMEAGVEQAARLPAVLARGGLSPTGERVLSPATAAAVVSLMATCGMYDESGAYLLETGLPAKSGVSGVIVAVAPGRGGIAVASPRVNHRGGSVRGHRILRTLSRALDWHIGLPAVIAPAAG
jgi:glutaminase